MKNIDPLILEAIALSERAKEEGAGIIEEDLAGRISVLSEEMDLDDLIPGEGKELGMAARNKDGKTFYRLFKARIRENLCAPDGEFAKLIRTGIHSSVGATVTALITTLGLPMAALPLLIPISALICHSGLEAFCHLHEEA